jgi:predicted secreted protein
MSGDLLGLEIAGSFVECETSSDFSFETDMRGASAVTSGRWKEVIPGLRSWSITLNAMMLLRMAGTGVNTILNAFLTGEKMGIRFMVKDPNYPNFIISGNAFVQSGTINGQARTKASWNTTLTGSGPFEVEVNTNMVFAISTNIDDTEVLQDGQENLTVSTNGN